MCGLVYEQNFLGNAVNEWIITQYGAQQNRGKQGFGLFDGEHGHMVHAAEEDRILRWLCREDNASSLIMFHHRNPTSTINVKQAAHPFATKAYFGDDEYILIHNGIIYNAEERYKVHTEMGIEYHSLLEDGKFNDSEALLWDFALWKEGKIEKMECYGMIGFICVKLHKGELERMFFYRNTSPLKMERTKESLKLSSEGAGEMVERDKLFNWHYASKRLTDSPLELRSTRWVSSTYIPGNYSKSHYPSSYTDGSYAAWHSEHWWEDDDDYPTMIGDGKIVHKLSKKERKRLKAANRAQTLIREADKRIAEGWNTERQTAPTVAEKTEESIDMVTPTKNEIPNEFSSNYRDFYYDYNTRLWIPTSRGADIRKMIYLSEASGNYEEACERAEAEYALLQKEEPREDTSRELRMQQKVIESICFDPEFLDEDSISKDWLRSKGALV